MARITIHPLEVVQPCKHASSNNVSGGSGNGSGEDSWIYYDLKGIDNEILLGIVELGVAYPSMLHTTLTSSDGETFHYIKSIAGYHADRDNVLYIAFDIKWEACYLDIEGTLLEFIEKEGLTELFSSIPRITKEEFYNLEA